MSRTAQDVRTVDDYEARLRSYYLEAGEEGRAVRVGEKETSEQAAIVRRYADLFTRSQLDALAQPPADADATTLERVHRLRRSCESGLVVAELASVQDDLVNAELGVTVEFRGESIPLRSARARVGLISDYGEREELGTAAWNVSAELNERRLELLRAAEALFADLSETPDPVLRSEREKGISLHDLTDALGEATEAAALLYDARRTRWLDRLLGSDREPVPRFYHAAYVFRLTPLSHIYDKDRAAAICTTTLGDIGLDLVGHRSIHTDLEDRPQKTARPCVIAPDPPNVVHLITRSVGGLQDYAGLLHEAGHAFHYAGSDPGLPYAFRALARDNALSETYAFLCESITREPGWHARYFELSNDEAEENADAARFLHALMVRRFLAKLRFELDFWSRFRVDGGTADGYAENLTEATGFAYRSDAFLLDLDAGFYSADYLRGWVRAAQLRSHLVTTIGPEWWCRKETGELLTHLYREGLAPSNEDLAGRLGFEPGDTAPLLAELSEPIR